MTEHLSSSEELPAPSERIMKALMYCATLQDELDALVGGEWFPAMTRESPLLIADHPNRVAILQKAAELRLAQRALFSTPGD